MAAPVKPGHPSRIVLLGHPVTHSLSPVFQNAAIRAAGIAAEYGVLDVETAQLEEVVRSQRSGSFAGNVTIPHKHSMAALCDVLSPLAKRTAAVNTFWESAGLLHGDNTDVAGFHRAVVALLGREPQGERVALFGAGGSAAAILAAVEMWPASKVAVFNRTPQRGNAVVSNFATIARVVFTPEELLAEATIVVNATPVGLRDDILPIPVELIPAGAALLDLVYRSGETVLVRAARARGNRAADGREMLLEQGALAFMRWFDVAPNKMVMREALARAILPG